MAQSKKRKKRVVVQYSEKGGVGKSSLTTGMTAVAAEDGEEVVAADLDPRATVTEELGIEVDSETLTVNDLLFIPEGTDPVDPAEAIGDVLQPAGEHWPDNVRVLPAERQLAHRETDLNAIEGRLARALETLDVDWVFIDVPPRAGGKLVTAALMAATHVIVPATLTTDGHAGVVQARRSMRLIRQGANPNLKYMGIVRSIVPRDSDRRAVHDLVEGDLKRDFPGEVIEAQVHEYAIREDCRYTSVPITSAPGPHAKILVGEYRDLINHIRTGRELSV